MAEKEKHPEGTQKTSLLSRWSSRLSRLFSPEFYFEKKFTGRLERDVNITPIIKNMKDSGYPGFAFDVVPKQERYSRIAVFTEGWWQFFDKEPIDEAEKQRKQKLLDIVIKRISMYPLEDRGEVAMTTVLEYLMTSVKLYLDTEEATVVMKRLVGEDKKLAYVSEFLQKSGAYRDISPEGVTQTELSSGLGTAISTMFSFFDLLPKLLEKKGVSVTRKTLKALAESSYGSVIKRLSTLYSNHLVEVSAQLYGNESGEQEEMMPFGFSPELFYLNESKSGYKVKINHFALFIKLFFKAKDFWLKRQQPLVWCPANYARDASGKKDVIKSLFEWCLDLTEKAVWADYPEE